MKIFTKVYSTPSKIKFSNNSKLNKAGIEYVRKVELFYPGLSDQDFSKFHDLVHQKFVMYIEMLDGVQYQISTTEVPMRLATKFSSDKGTILIFQGSTFYRIVKKTVQIQNLNSVYEIGVYEIGVFE